jgi:transcriptional regulator
MYVPPHFHEQRVEVLHRLIREHPLAALVTLSRDGLSADHIPFEIDAEPEPFGTLRGHVARANPVWRSFSQAVESLAIFSGPQAYVSPSWYPSKTETGEVVPTYNYVVVHAYGPLTIVHDRAWLRGLVNRLTKRFEAGRKPPWRVTDAPAPFIENQLGAIVGIEIPISRLIGKVKVSQNRARVDREGAARGLSEMTDADSQDIAQWIRDKLET